MSFTLTPLFNTYQIPRIFWNVLFYVHFLLQKQCLTQDRFWEFLTSKASADDDDQSAINIPLKNCRKSLFEGIIFGETGDSCHKELLWSCAPNTLEAMSATLWQLLVLDSSEIIPSKSGVSAISEGNTDTVVISFACRFLWYQNLKICFEVRHWFQNTDVGGFRYGFWSDCKKKIGKSPASLSCLLLP